MKADNARGDSATTALRHTMAGTETMQLAEFHSHETFGTPIEERFERLTRLGRQLFRVPVIAITAIADQTQWFKSVLGWEVTELPLKDSLCRQVVESAKPVLIGDLLRNPQFATHPLVAKQPAFRFYCGIPLLNTRGTVIGTLCAMGYEPRKIHSNVRVH